MPKEIAEDVSFRKNALIVLLIIALCTVLVMQLVPNEPLGMHTGAVSPIVPDDGTKAKEDDAPSEIRFSMDVHVTEPSYRALSELLREAERELPHVRIELASHPMQNSEGRLVTAAESGELADLLLLDFDWIGTFAASGYLARWPAGYPASGDDPLSQAVSWNGYRWAVPFETDPYVVAYNGSQEALSPDEALPNTPEEWADFRVRRSAAGMADGLVYSDPDDPRAFVSLLAAMGGGWERLEDGQLVPDENSLSAMDLLFGSIPEDDKSGPLYPLAVTEKLEEEEMWRRFSEGSLPLVVVPLSRLSAQGFAGNRIPGLVEDDLPVSPWINGTAFAVSSTASDPAQAFEFLVTLLSGHDPGKEAILPSRGHSPFAGEPDLADSLGELADAMSLLYAGEIDAEGFLERMVANKPAP